MRVLESLTREDLRDMNGGHINLDGCGGFHYNGLARSPSLFGLMDFSALNFWLTLIPFLLLLALVNKCIGRDEASRRRNNRYFILLTSLTLLGIASTLTLLIFCLVAIVAYVICRAAEPLQRGRRLILGLLIALLLLPLLYYKYGYFICSNLEPDRDWDTLRHLVIPIGISFYTFQIIGFCIDTLIRRLPVPGFIDYMNFCSFFPQIVAGPIERRDDLLPQVREMKLRPDETSLVQGISYVILGLFFKGCVADNLAANFPGARDVEQQSAYLLWLNNLSFTFRIYFDFAGYGLTAYGLGKCMGIKLRLNFLSPYTSTNVSEFWRRWHTSLTLWFRDYIYFPLGGSRTKRWALNILIVFLISGLWHGANWNFIVWGAVIGITMIIHRIFRKRGHQLPGWAGWLLTFLCTVVIWMFFYEQDFSVISERLQLMFSSEAYGIRHLATIASEKEFAYLIAGALPPLLLSLLIILGEAVSQRRYEDPYRIFLNPWIVGLMVFLLTIYTPGIASPFIYFAF